MADELEARVEALEAAQANVTQTLHTVSSALSKLNPVELMKAFNDAQKLLADLGPAVPDILAFLETWGRKNTASG